MPDRLLLICAVIDVATSEKPRSLKEFLRRPRLPIREMYLTRVVINLVYFARNYLNFVLLFVAASAFVYPMVLLVLASAVALHVVKRKVAEDGTATAPPTTISISPSDTADIGVIAAPPHRPFSRVCQIGAKVFQIAACLLVTQQYGFFTLLFVNATPMLVVAAHAALTPYTDDAMEHYESVMVAKGFHAPAPRSPTKDFENVDKMFQEALLRNDDASLASGTTGGGSTASAALPASERVPNAVQKGARGSPAGDGPRQPGGSEEATSSRPVPPLKIKRLLNPVESSKQSRHDQNVDEPSQKVSAGWIPTPAASSLPVIAAMRHRAPSGA